MTSKKLYQIQELIDDSEFAEWYCFAHNLDVYKEVKDYEGLYEVSMLGKVRSIDYRRTGVTKELTLNRSGKYYTVVLSKNGVKRTHSVHRLVAEAFIPNPGNLPQVNHKDENTFRNTVFNLEWCDAKYNTNYGTGVLRRSRLLAGRYNTKLSVQIHQFDKSMNFLKTYQSVREASRQTKISSGHICECCKGIRKTAGGFVWSYNK